MRKSSTTEEQEMERQQPDACYVLFVIVFKAPDSTEAEKGQSKNILQIPKNILNRNIILKSLSKSLTNLKNYCKS